MAGHWEPFTIHCATCHARLRVRKPEAINTIVACPKCAAMVMIERPSAAVPTSGDSPVDASIGNLGSELDGAARTEAIRHASTSPNEEVYDHIGDLLDDRPEPHDHGLEQRLPPFAGSASPHDDEPGNLQPTEQSLGVGFSSEEYDDVLAVARRADDGDPAIEASPLAADWNGSRIESVRPWLFAAGAGLLGVVAAVGAIRIVAGRSVETTRQATNAFSSDDTSPELGSLASPSRDAEAIARGGLDPDSDSTPVRERSTSSADDASADDVPTNARPEAVESLATKGLNTEKDETGRNETRDPIGAETAPRPVDQFGQILEERVGGTDVDDSAVDGGGND